MRFPKSLLFFIASLIALALLLINIPANAAPGFTPGEDCWQY